MAHAYYSRANTLRDTGQYLFALSDYEKARRYGYPEAHMALYGQAVTYALLGRPQHAEKLLRQALAAKPDFPAARKKLDELTQGPATGSFYARMVERVDAIVAASLPPIAADRVVRSAPRAPEPPPRQLLEAAGQVAFATWRCRVTARSALAQLPSAMAPAFVISERQFFRKDQERIAAGEEPEGLTIEPVSAPPVELAAVAPPGRRRPRCRAGWCRSTRSATRPPHGRRGTPSRPGMASFCAARSAVVQKADLGADGVVFRLRVKNLASRAEAVSLCGKLRKRGQDCFVTRAGA